MGKIIPFSLINEPTWCPLCFRRDLKFIDPYNNKVLINEDTLERNQKYFIFCPNCNVKFHIYWEGDKFYPVYEDEYIKEFTDNWIENNKENKRR